MPVLASVGLLDGIVLRQRSRAAEPPRRNRVGRRQRSTRAAARQPDRSRPKVRRRAASAEDRPGLPRVRPLPGLRRRADVDRRSRSAGADHPVEAGRDDRVHAHDLRRRSIRISARRPFDVGLYSTEGSEAAAADRRRRSGQRAYGSRTIELLPQSENIFLIFKDGWHPPKSRRTIPPSSGSGPRRTATIRSGIPSATPMFYLQLDGRPDFFAQPQQVTVAHRRQLIDTFIARQPKSEIIRKIPVTAAQLGRGRHGRAQHSMSIGRSCRRDHGAPTRRDPRELGVRVFHAFVEPQAEPISTAPRRVLRPDCGHVAQLQACKSLRPSWRVLHCASPRCIAFASRSSRWWPLLVARQSRPPRSSSSSRPAARCRSRASSVEGDCRSCSTLRERGRDRLRSSTDRADRARRGAVSRAAGAAERPPRHRRAGARIACILAVPIRARSSTRWLRGHGVDPTLVSAVIQVESGYQPSARSPRAQWA